MKLTSDEIREAVRTLKTNKAGTIDGSYIGILHPKTTYDLQADSAWVNANQYAGSTNIFNGEVGKLWGVRFIESQNAKVFAGAGSGGIDVYGTLIMGREYFGMADIAGSSKPEVIVKPVGASGTLDPLNQRGSIGWKAYFVAARLDNNAAVRIEHATS